MRESTLTFSEFNFPKRWSIGKVSVKSLMFKHFVKVVWTVFVVSVVVDTASLSAEIGTDTGNKGNIILGNVLSKTRNYHSFFKLSSANFSLRKSRKQFWIFEKVYTETYTYPHCHKPTQNNVTQTNTDTHQPKIMSHRSKIIYLVQLENVRQIMAERLTLKIWNDWNSPKMLLSPLSTICGAYSTRKSYV